MNHRVSSDRPLHPEPLSPEDAGRIIVDLREKTVEDKGRVDEVVAMPPFVTVPAIQDPLLSTYEVAELRHAGLRPLTGTIPVRSSFVENGTVALEAEPEF